MESNVDQKKVSEEREDEITDFEQSVLSDYQEKHQSQKTKEKVDINTDQTIRKRPYSHNQQQTFKRKFGNLLAQFLLTAYFDSNGL